MKGGIDMYQLVVKNTYKGNKAEKSQMRAKPKLSWFIIAVLIFALVIFIGYTSQGSIPQEYKIVEVNKGDTLWSIAVKYNINNEDPRKLINEIKKINNLETIILQPGQMIKIPG